MNKECPIKLDRRTETTINDRNSSADAVKEGTNHANWNDVEPLPFAFTITQFALSRCHAKRERLQTVKPILSIHGRPLRLLV